jgi:hypothetical protein
VPSLRARSYATVGSPRLISLLADRLLLAAYSRQAKPVPRSILESKALEIKPTRLTES